jgi:predicted membrane protein
MAGMGVVARAIDKLPTWVQAILMAFGIVACVYGIAHYGWSFIFHIIFSPDLSYFCLRNPLIPGILDATHL